MSLPAYEIITLVTHHPARPLGCLVEALRSLVQATWRKHLIHVCNQGPSESWEGLVPLVGNVAFRVTDYPDNQGPVAPRIDSVALAKSLPSVKWWAKLDDDGTVPPGAWDALIEVLEEDDGVAYTMASPNGETPPRLLRLLPGMATIESGSFGTFETENARGSYCSFVGDGATVFRKAFFDDAFFDARFVRGADVDLAMQARLYDYRCAMCETPASVHQHAKCSPEDYDRVRYDAQLVWDAAKVFREKWGLDCPHLSQFGVRNA